MRFLARLKKAKKSLLIFTLFFTALMGLIMASLYSMLAPSAFNLRVPENVNDITIVDSTTDKVSIDSLGNFHFNGMPIEKVDLENQLRENSLLVKNEKYQVIVLFEPEAKTEILIIVLDMARRLDIDAILQKEE